MTFPFETLLNIFAEYLFFPNYNLKMTYNHFTILLSFVLDKIKIAKMLYFRIFSKKLTIFFYYR